MLKLFLLPSLGSALLLILWLWALFDVIMTDSLLIRNMQKGTWIFLIIVIPPVGAVAWLLLGRPEGAAAVPGGRVRYQYKPSPSRSERRPVGAEDSDNWSTSGTTPSRPSSVGDSESLAIRERKLMEKEAELAKREEAINAQDPEPTED